MIRAQLVHALFYPTLTAAVAFAGRGPAGAAPRKGSKQPDSRDPAEAPRPAGALLRSLPAELKLEGQDFEIHCRYQGRGCYVTVTYAIRNLTAKAVRAPLELFAPPFGISVKLDGNPSQAEVAETGPLRTWTGSDRGLDPGTGATYPLRSRKRSRTVSLWRFTATFPPGRTRKLSVRYYSVAGYDRFRRNRTMPEMGFYFTRRRDHFVYHHQVLLRSAESPAPRPKTPGVPPIRMTVSFPARLMLGTDAPKRCRPAPNRERVCVITPHPGKRMLRISLTERRLRPVGIRVAAGATVSGKNVRPLFQFGISVMLRRRQDVLGIDLETDAWTRVGLAAVYRLFTPWKPFTHSMGAHFGLGALVEYTWASDHRARPAFRLETAMRFAYGRVGVLADFFPLDMAKKNEAFPWWRVGLAAGVGF